MYYSNKLSNYKSISHCFLSQKGGSSKGIYKSLNCGKGSFDNKNDVNKNFKFILNNRVRMPVRSLYNGSEVFTKVESLQRL